MLTHPRSPRGGAVNSWDPVEVGPGWAQPWCQGADTPPHTHTPGPYPSSVHLCLLPAGQFSFAFLLAVGRLHLRLSIFSEQMLPELCLSHV